MVIRSDAAFWPTIAAIATPPGVGGVAIVRVSGPQAKTVAAGCLRLKGSWRPRQAHFARLLDAAGGVIDEGLVLWMPAPGSYTGEETVEFHGHGGPYVSRRVLDRFIECGAEPAAPGEFTRRALLNGRLDLTQAEALADLLSARTATGHQQAMAGLSGALARPLLAVREAIMTLVAQLEAGIDFPDEVDLPSSSWFHGEVAAVLATVDGLIATSTAGQVYREGAKVVLVGRPNVGKSSLLNALLRHDRAIVTEHAGTTRDTLEEACDLDGVLVHLVDTAGLRDASDPIEQLGVERSRQAMAEAMLVLHVVDAAAGLTADDRAIAAEISGPVLLVANKADLAGAEVPGALPVSAKTGTGLDALAATVRERVVTGLVPPSQATVNMRQRACLVRAREALLRAQAASLTELSLDLLTIDLREALAAVSDVSGDGLVEAVLDQVFARFCVGK